MAKLAVAKKAICNTDAETLQARNNLLELQKSLLLDQQKEELEELEEAYLNEARGTEKSKGISQEIRTLRIELGLIAPEEINEKY